MMMSGTFPEPVVHKTVPLNSHGSPAKQERNHNTMQVQISKRLLKLISWIMVRINRFQLGAERR